MRSGQIKFGQRHTEREYRERLEYELSLIEQMGYSEYFLIVSDYVNYAKGQGIPVGPGRGSGAGSLVAYCTRITDIDSIRFGLIFERFLNPERISMPDIDVDFCYNRRGEVIDYVVQKYGEDHVSQIATFGTLAARAAVRDTGRALGMSYGEVDVVARAIPQQPGMTIGLALKMPELKQLYESSEQVRKLVDTAASLEGCPGISPCGRRGDNRRRYTAMCACRNSDTPITVRHGDHREARTAQVRLSRPALPDDNKGAEEQIARPTLSLTLSLPLTTKPMSISRRA